MLHRVIKKDRLAVGHRINQVVINGLQGIGFAVWVVEECALHRERVDAGLFLEISAHRVPSVAVGDMPEAA